MKLAFRRCCISIAALTAVASAIGARPAAAGESLPRAASAPARATRCADIAGETPVALAISPTAGGRYLLALTTRGRGQGITVLDRATLKRISFIDLGKPFAGMAFDDEGDDIFIAGGPAASKQTVAAVSDPRSLALLQAPIARLKFDDDTGALKIGRVIDIPGLAPDSGRYIAAVASGEDEAVYAVSRETDTVYKLAGHPRSVVAKAKVGARPVACAISDDGGRAAVADLADNTVVLLDCDTLKETARLTTGKNPAAVIWSGKRLFVTNVGAGTISVIENGRVADSIRIGSPQPAGPASPPPAMAVSHDGKRLFVAGMSASSVIEVDGVASGGRRSIRFLALPARPSALAVAPDDKTLYAATDAVIPSSGASSPDNGHASVWSIRL